MDDVPLTIKTAAQRAGLSTHVIRVWEKRYGAISPERTTTRRRLYSREQVERLALLARLTRTGRTIGTIAQLPTTTLRALADEGDAVPARTIVRPASDGSLVDRCLEAVRQMEAEELEATLTRAEVQLGAQGMLRRVVAPLAQAIGEQWREGTISAAHEHFASAVLRSYLLRATHAYAPGPAAPVLVITTPAGQLHELGALLVAVSAANLGWRCLYLGGSLPAAEIAGAARQQRARAVAISLVYPEDDPAMAGELERLRTLLPADCALIAGGRAMTAYGAALEKIGARRCGDLDQLGQQLDELRIAPATS